MKVRLNRYLSECGVTSRRKADEMISAGKVKVNGTVIRELGTIINPESDSVSIGSKEIKPERKRYILLNKPRLVLTTLLNKEDNKPTIADFIRNIGVRVYPVGRLDYDSEGLLLLTNDGELANRIHHPSYGIKKTYNAVVKGIIDEKSLKKMKTGAKLDGKFIRPDNLTINRLKNGNTAVVIAFHEGKKHLVKNYLKYFGFPVERLKRTSIGNLRLGKLPTGGWRDLTAGELKILKEKTGLV